MRLIEKKCPNCGANLEFNENDKSCKCTYCKRSFEIERDLNDVEKFNLIYDKIHKPMKWFMFIPFIFVFIIIVIIIVTNIFSFRNFHKDFDNDNNPIKDIMDVVDEKNKLITDVSELTNDDLEDLDHKSFSVLNQDVVGRSDTTYNYQKTGDPRLEKIYVASKEDSNRVISIYKVIYHNFFNQTDQQTVFVPVIFEDVKQDVLFSLANGKNPAPEYYFNSDQSSYIYAYKSFEDAYNGIVQPLSEEYTISEK